MSKSGYFREEDNFLVARNEWSEYIICRDGSDNHATPTIKITAETYDTIDVAKEISGAVDGWFFVEKSVHDALRDDE